MESKNYYIKYELNNKEAFNKAIDKAKELGYGVWDYQDSLTGWNVKGILTLTNNEGVKEFYVPIETEKELIKMGFEQIIL